MQDPIEIELASNDGWSSVAFSVYEVTSIQGVKHVVLNIKAHSQFWDSVSLLRSGKQELTRAGEAQIFRVVTPLARIEKMLNHFDDWLVAQTAFRVTLTDNPDQSVEIQLGPSSEFISSESKPVLKFKYTSSRFGLEARFVTDQSCVSLFVDGLKRMTLPRN